LGRFECPTSNLELDWLIANTRRAFYAALLVALALHAGLTQIRSPAEEERAVKPLTTKFIKREPRLVKPLELRKRPRPKPRPMRRKVVTVKAKVSHREMMRAEAPPLRVLDSLAKPRAGISRTVPFEPVRLETYVGSAVIEGDKEPEERIDMSLEMLDIESLDTGRYQAMIIQDPRDKKKIRGFFYFSFVYIESMAAAYGNSAFGSGGVAQIIPHLVDAMNRYTDIKCYVGKAFPVTSEQLFKIPWVTIRSQSHFKLTDAEAEYLGKYMTSGGFVFGEDDGPHIGWRGDIAIRNMFKDALAAVGKRYGEAWQIGRYLDYENNTRQLQFGVNLIIFALTQEGSITRRVMQYVE